MTPTNTDYLLQVTTPATDRPYGAAGASDGIPLLRDRPMVNGQPTAYVCENFTCKQPVTDVAAFEAEIES